MRVLLIAMLLTASAAGAQTLPDAPKPKQNLDARLAARYPDLFGMDKPVKSTGEAARQPSMLAFEALLVGATAVDIEGTQHCEADHQCRELNPILGTSRAQQYGIAMPLSALGIIAAAKARQHGHGNWAAFALWGASAVHLMYGVRGFRELGIKR